MTAVFPYTATRARIVDKTLPEYMFDPDAGVYRNVQTGDTVPDNVVRAGIVALVAGAKAEAVGYVRDLRHGRIDLRQFAVAMGALLTALHTASITVGTGAMPGLAAEAEAQLRATLLHEKQYLTGFVRDLTAALGAYATGLVGEPTLLVWQGRAQSYMDAGLVSYEMARYRRMLFLDYTECQRVMNPEAEHCNGCEAQARKGWIPLADLAPLGGEECGQWCKCDVEYRRAGLVSAQGA